MPVFLQRLWRRTQGHSAWLLPALIATFVFLTSWGLMAWAQPGSDIAQARNYWWYFLITTTTVGYGDLFPDTTAGRLVGGYVVAGGITTIAVILSRIGSAIESKKGRRMQGEGTFSGSGHIVILGFHPGRTEQLVRTLLEDHARRHVVLGAWEDQAAEHPMRTHERVHFIKGDLTEATVLKRASMERARSVLVDGRDDNEAVTLTIAAATEAPEAHTVVALRDLRWRRTIERVDTTVHCVQWHNTQLIAEELQDPGIAEVYADLATPGGASTHSAVVPDSAAGRDYGAWQQAVGAGQGVTLLALRAGDAMQVNPAWTTPVRPGDRLYYVATRRFTGDELAGWLRD